MFMISALYDQTFHLFWRLINYGMVTD